MKNNFSVVVRISSLLVMGALLVLGIQMAFGANASSSATVTNSVPVASSPVLDGGTAITLTTNASTSVIGTVTITDNNGCEDITSVNATLFRTNLTGGSGAADDNASHYSIECTAEADCTAGGSDLTRGYNCTFNVTHYADPTDAGSTNAAANWTFNATPYDGTTGTVASTTQELNTLTSLSLDTSTIAFGSLALGANTSTSNQNTSIANHGNEGLDVSLTGFGATSGDNFSMNCTSGNLQIHNLEYSGASFTFGAGTDLTNTSTELDLDLLRGNQTITRPTRLVYYGLIFPSTGVGGSCTGTVSITATSDPNVD